MKQTTDLFADTEPARCWVESLAPGAVILRGFARAESAALDHAISAIAHAAPFRHMQTPGGKSMSVAMTNCGRYGWVTDRSGYRYSAYDPATGQLWPSMPAVFLELAAEAAVEAGYKDFIPDACLVNRYQTGARLALHQDKNERDFDAPIVSVSLGVPATFMFGGLRRADRPARVPLVHGDVVVWGGPARLRYHGVAALKAAEHEFAGPDRINLTLRKAA